MKQYRSNSERDYKGVYRELRLGGGWYDGSMHNCSDDVIVDCAILSYEYHDSEFSGWVNRQRLTAFQSRSSEIANWRGYIPF